MGKSGSPPKLWRRLASSAEILVKGANARNTDEDWHELGVTQPYWGVLSHPDFRVENLTPENLEKFYETGLTDISRIVYRFELAFGAKPAGQALDFGCGAGRLTEAMASYVDQVIGYDISPGMLELARSRGGRPTYLDKLPAFTFDWINSFIVLQHIPPTRGMGIIEQLLSQLAPGGFISLHLTVWHDGRPRTAIQSILHRVHLTMLKRGLILMYDYDISAVARLFHGAGIRDMTLISVDHDVHHGYIFLGRR